MTATKDAKFLEVSINAAARSVSATFGNGLKAIVEYDKLPDNIKIAAGLLGLSNKVRDTGANFAKEKKFDEAHDAMVATIAALYAGNWNRNGSGPGVSLKDLARALAELQKATLEWAVTAVDKADDAMRKKWADHAGIALLIKGYEVERLRAKAATATDADGLPTPEPVVDPDAIPTPDADETQPDDAPTEPAEPAPQAPAKGKGK
jgi:hypothetical protein